MADVPLTPISAVDCVRPAVSRAENILLHPMRWSRWWRLAMLGLATGEAATQGFNFNFPSSGDWSKIANAGGSGGATASAPDVSSLPHIPGLSDARIAFIITVLVVGFATLLIVHLWVSSVARFMLLDAVATGRYRLREGWKRWGSQGFRYFLFQLLFLAANFAVMLLIFGIPLLLAWKAGVFSHFKERWGVLLMELMVALPVYLLVALVFALFGLMVKDFVVPVIALEHITIPEAIRKVWSMVKSAKGNYAIYVLIKIVLAIAIGIGLTIVYVIFALILIVPTVLIAVAIGVSSPHFFQDPVTIALMITLALLATIPAIFVVGLIGTPAVVFYQSFVMNFFGSRYTPLWVFMHPGGVPAPPSPPQMDGGHEPPPYDIVPPEPAG
jgi:hypothetical protein